MAVPPVLSDLVGACHARTESGRGGRTAAQSSTRTRTTSLRDALDLSDLDLDRRRGSVLVRRGKKGRRREVGMDDWGFEQLEPWLIVRKQMPVGPLFCVIDGRTCGRAWPASAARAALRRRAARAGCEGASRRTSYVTLTRSSSHVRRAAQRHCANPGIANLGVTSICLQGIDPDEIIQTVHGRRPPMIPPASDVSDCAG